MQMLAVSRAFQRRAREVRLRGPACPMPEAELQETNLLQNSVVEFQPLSGHQGLKKRGKETKLA